MQAFYNDVFSLSLPSGHRFPMGKYRRLREVLEARLPQMPGLTLQVSESATAGELALAHDPGYVAAVFDGTLSAEQVREIGFPWTPSMVERSRRSVGATIAAARAALAEGIAGSLGGGTHHALADRGGGYCVFNDLAVAARLMQAERHRRHPEQGLRVAVIDLDVHQGNGTAAIFDGDHTVFTLSMHGARNFPFRKVPGDLDVDLPDGCGDDEYLAALDGALAELWRRHGDHPPGLVFYQAGVDVHVDDRLGRLSLTTAAIAERDRRVMQQVSERGIPLVLTMGGGYGEDMDTTVMLQTRTWETAYATWRWWQARGAPSVNNATP